VQPLGAVTERVRARRPGALVHTDAVQAATWVDVAERAAEADLISLSAHKIGGPKGVGALVVRSGVTIEAQLVGGGQERGRRSGTHNVAGIVGFGAAAAEALTTRKQTVDRVDALRGRLLDRLTSAGVTDWRLTVAAAPGVEVVPGIVSLCFADVESEALLFLVDQAGLCASAGSSCSSGAVGLSHVLAAMDVDPRWGRGALRLSLGWSSTAEDVDRAVEIVGAAVSQLRRSRP
jgi:cysteine desulfurase